MNGLGPEEVTRDRPTAAAYTTVLTNWMLGSYIWEFLNPRARIF